MKFCDKLQKIRKENNITQEGLADKLNVSRQAVSKWESGTAYPDTEKLIQISKIFNISLDELINDNKEINKSNYEEKKFDVMETIKIIGDFLSKSFSMFWAMKFREKVKCIFEMGILILTIMLIAYISDMIIVEIVRRIFMFLPGNIVINICNLVDTLLFVIWTILGFIIVIRIFKTRYLDYYVIISDENINERTLEEPIKELKEKKDYKLVIRDPKDSSFNIFNKLWKIILLIFKIFALFILIPIVTIFIALVILEVVSLSYLLNGLFFNGISVALLGMVIVTYLFILFIYNLIFNRENDYKKIFILFILSISLIGMGFGLSFASLGTFRILDDYEEKIDSYELEYSDNLIFSDLMNLSNEQIVIDNNLNNIKIDIITYNASNIKAYTYYTYNDDNDNGYKFAQISYTYDDIEVYKNIINNLKEKKISKYYNDYKIDKIYLSENHLTKLKENYHKYYD